MTDSLLQAMARAICRRAWTGKSRTEAEVDRDWENYIADAVDALTAHDEHLAEQGLVVVPREPSESEWMAYKEMYPMFGPPEHLADEARVEKYYRRLRSRLEQDRQLMLTAYETEK